MGMKVVNGNQLILSFTAYVVYKDLDTPCSVCNLDFLIHRRYRGSSVCFFIRPVFYELFRSVPRYVTSSRVQVCVFVVGM
jgi:hypothetical protein